MKKNYILLITIFILCGFNQVKSQTGKFLHFDGIDDEINCGNNASIQISGTGITLETIIKFDSFRNNVWQGNIINKEESSPDTGYMLRAGGNGTINFNIGDGQWNELNTPPNTISTNVWYHIAATYDGNDMKIYLDGTEVASRNFVENISSNSSNLFVGNWAQTGDRHINATIDEVRIWDIARTSSEISNNINNELTLPQAGLVLYYKFNQGTANGNNTFETTANDELTNNNGALLNFTLNGTTSNWVADSTLSISEYNNNTKIVLSPNPSYYFIQISGIDKEIFSIYNILGAKIKSGIISVNEKIDIRNFTSGLYFLKFENGNTIKFLKK